MSKPKRQAAAAYDKPELPNKARRRVLLLPQVVDALEELCKRHHLTGPNRLALAVEMLVLDEMIRRVVKLRVRESLQADDKRRPS